VSKKYSFSQKQVAELKTAKKANKNKNIDNRLRALLLRAQGVKQSEVSKQTVFSKQYITDLTANYCKNGITAIVENHYHGNRRNMSFEDEAAFLAQYTEQASLGQLIEVSEIKRAYEEKVGHSIGGSQIYRVLKRHSLRKIMPRSKHPKKASDEVIEASKKLTESVENS
jgi:transposase